MTSLVIILMLSQFYTNWGSFPYPHSFSLYRSGKRASVGGREGSSGGLRNWWSKFSGRSSNQDYHWHNLCQVMQMTRFKKLTPAPGGGEEVSAEIALGNDLHYKQLVPQVSVVVVAVVVLPRLILAMASTQIVMVKVLVKLKPRPPMYHFYRKHLQYNNYCSLLCSPLGSPHLTEACLPRRPCSRSRR